MSSLSISLANLACNPWIFLVASRPLFAYGAGFTSPKSLQRYALFVILCSYVWLTLANFTAYIRSTSFLANLFAATIFNLPLVYFDRLILRQWAFEDRYRIFTVTAPRASQEDSQKSEKVPISGAGGDTIGSRFAFGNEVGNTVRGPGTSWEVKGLPHFSNSDPQWVPSPLIFISWRVSIIIGCVSTYHYAVDLRDPLNKDLCQPSNVPFLARLGDVTVEELWTRLIINTTFWFGGYCILQIFFSVPSIIAVCLHPSSVSQWHPAFGSVLEAYTLRKFWG